MYCKFFFIFDVFILEVFPQDVFSLRRFVLTRFVPVSLLIGSPSGCEDKFTVELLKLSKS